jgi:hypothetical protein
VKPGDLVRVKHDHRSAGRCLWRYTGWIGTDRANQELCDINKDELLLVVAVVTAEQDLGEEAMLLTHVGCFGWVLTVHLVRVVA